jgi:hypothetical protein
MRFLLRVLLNAVALIVSVVSWALNAAGRGERRGKRWPLEPDFLNGPAGL